MNPLREPGVLVADERGSQSRAGARAALTLAILALSSGAVACSPSAERAGGAERGPESKATMSSAACTQSRIVGNSIGPLAPGLTSDQVREECTASDTTFTLGEGMMERGLTMPLSAGGAVIALLVGDTVERIMVTGPGPRTDLDIGVGSTIAELREAYPDACVASGEGRLYAIAPGTGISFQTTSPVGPANPRIEMLPDTTTVSQVIIHGHLDGGCS
jgi:hypothetical protein